MALRRMCICLAFFVVIAFSQSSEARHATKREASDYAEVPQNDGTEDEMLNDYGGEQNDADAGDDDEEVVNAEIVTKPNHYKPNLGDNLRLECKTQPSENVIVSWTKNKDEKLFIGSKQVKVDAIRFSLDRTDLIIRDITHEDSGTYTCDILQTTTTQVTHIVFVHEPAKINRLTASKTDIVEGDEVLLTCNATGVPPPTIYWSRSTDGGNTTTGLTDADGEFSANAIFMKNVRKEQSGIYYCLVENTGARKPVLKSITINVASKPKVHAHKGIVNTAVGTEAELICTTHLNHAEIIPVIQWYKDGKSIEEARVSSYTVSTEGARSILKIKPATDADFGTYTCTASNRHGSHSRQIELVQHPVIEDFNVDGPKITWTVHSHQQLEDMELQFRNVNETTGNWELKSVPIPESQNGPKYGVIYEIKDADLKDGQYEVLVKVKNSNGWSKQRDPVFINIDRRPQLMKSSDVLRGSLLGSSAALPPSSAMLSTILMYLLVRMF
ncbi:protein amalgam-like [Hyposmocoma kahamanoa]|uniref:protein amalgam-like n=1 Tax=Hyposmocoma kahamanoa TaxID=1477025 RepID=UPI000E6D6B85|nr:protein amalgam-like [Hyposmocoma kahamanoa]